MKSLFKFLAPMLLAVAAACSGGGTGPGDVVQQFNMALADGDVDTAIEHIQPSQRETIRPKLNMIAPMAASQLEQRGGIDSIEITNEQIDGDTATVSYTVHYGNGEESEEEDTLTRVDGTWYVGMNG